MGRVPLTTLLVPRLALLKQLVPAAWSFEETCGATLVLLTPDKQLLTQVGPEEREGPSCTCRYSQGLGWARGWHRARWACVHRRCTRGLWPGLRALEAGRRLVELLIGE